MILLQCNDPTLLPILSIMKNVFLMIQIIGPIASIVALTLLLFKLMMNPEDKQDKIKHGIKNSVIALVLLFLIPYLVNLTMALLGDTFSVSACWNVADNYKMSSGKYNSTNDKNKVKIINDKKYDDGGTGSSNNNDIDSSDIASGETSERIAKAAEYYAWPEGTSKSKYCRFNGGGSTPQFMTDYRAFWPKYKNSSDKSVAAGTCCCHFARTCVVKGLGKKFSFTLLPSNSSKDESLRVNMEKLGFTRITFDGNYSSLKRGDVLYYRKKGSGGHVWIFLGNHKAAEGGHDSGYGGRITKVSNSKLSRSNKTVYYIFRSTK